MNYQYIEQLIERYFDCQTTLQEEQILRSFFSQDEVPAHLLTYAELFRYEAEAQQMSLGDDFDARVLALVEQSDSLSKPTNPRMQISYHSVMAPFFKAAAVVAIAITIGTAAEHAIGVQQAEDAATDAGAVAIDPYIKSSDIRNALHIKDVNKAEIKVSPDSLNTTTE